MKLDASIYNGVCWAPEGVFVAFSMWAYAIEGRYDHDAWQNL